MELARSILDSCGIILPLGQLTEIYDSKGLRYNLPPYCVCDPVLSIKMDDNTRMPNDVEGESNLVKIRMSDGKDFTINIGEQKNVSDIKSYIRNQENIDLKRRMVVLWCGKILDDSLMLQSLNLPNGAVLQVMVP